MFVHAAEIGKYNLDSYDNLDSYTSNTSNIIQSIPFNALPNSMIIYNNFLQKLFVTTSRNIDFIDIQILDDNNQFVNFNNISWSMSLCITSTKRIELNSGIQFSDITKNG